MRETIARAAIYARDSSELQSDVLFPGVKRGEMRAELHGALAALMQLGADEGKTRASGDVRVSVVAGTCNQRYWQPLRSRVPIIGRGLPQHLPPQRISESRSGSGPIAEGLRPLREGAF